MARSSDINQRISLSGQDEVIRGLEAIAAAGQRAGNTTRAALVAATSGANSFTAGTRNAAASSGQMRFALQNLSFQVNDIATSFASGGDAMRILAQQGGQVFQAIQQGGGLGNVLSAVGAGIRSMITPTTAAVAGFAALAGGFALVLARAQSSQNAIREFDAILGAMRRTNLPTGKDLEEVAQRLRDVGVSAGEARDAFKLFAREGGSGTAEFFERVVRTGANLNTVLGEGSLERFVSAVAKGGEPLAQFARQLGIVVPAAAQAASSELDKASQAAQNFSNSVDAALRGRDRAIADAQRRAQQQVNDLTRKKGTAEEEIWRASREQIAEINRQADQQLIDLQNQRNAKLAADNAAALAAYNKQVQDAAQAALDTGRGLFAQIEAAVAGANTRALSPFQEAIRNLSVEWGKLEQTLATSPFINQLITDLGNFVRSIENTIRWLDDLKKAWEQVPGVPKTPPEGGTTKTIWGGPVGLAEGGLIHGPGTGTSDSILARVSAGEFINKARAVQFWGADVFRSLNNLQFPKFAIGGPVMPRPSSFPRLARGALAAAAAGGGGSGGVPVHFHLDGSSFELFGARRVVEAMTRAARKSSMLSAGRRPSTA